MPLIWNEIKDRTLRFRRELTDETSFSPYVFLVERTIMSSFEHYKVLTSLLPPAHDTLASNPH